MKETWQTTNNISGKDQGTNNIGVKIEGKAEGPQTTLTQHSTRTLVKYPALPAKRSRRRIARNIL